MTPAPNATRAAGGLLPCPFCGEVPTLIRETDGSKWGAVVCCGTGPEVRTGYEDVEHWRDEAIAAWNRRAPLAPAVVDAGTLASAEALVRTYDDTTRAKVLFDHCDCPLDPCDCDRVEWAAVWDANAAARRAIVDALATAAQPARAVPSPDRLLDALRWALGVGGIFPPRPVGAGAYWWRTELVKRAGLRYVPEQMTYVLGDAPADASAEDKARAVRAAGGGA